MSRPGTGCDRYLAQAVALRAAGASRGVVVITTQASWRATRASELTPAAGRIARASHVGSSVRRQLPLASNPACFHVNMPCGASNGEALSSTMIPLLTAACVEARIVRLVWPGLRARGRGQGLDPHHARPHRVAGEAGRLGHDPHHAACGEDLDAQAHLRSG